MYDRIIYRPDTVYLTEEATQKETTNDLFGRWNYINGKRGCTEIVLNFSLGRYPIVRISALRLQSGHCWVKKVTANLPSLIHGHNGRPLCDQDEYFLALTRLAHVLKMVTREDGHHRLLPGIGSLNQGYFQGIECFAQVEDPSYRFLRAASLARKKHQKRAPRIYPTESIRFRSQQLDLQVYDKTTQMRGFSEVEATRIEAIFKKPERLAKEALRHLGLKMVREQVVATLNFSTGYGLLLQEVKQLSGFGWPADETELEKLNPTARHLIRTLRDDICDPCKLELALETYITGEKPCRKTARLVQRQMHAYAATRVVPTIDAYLPPRLDEVKWSAVADPSRESEYQSLLQTIQAPDKPDPLIAQAYAATKLINQPQERELVGPTMPSRLPFLLHTL